MGSNIQNECHSSEVKGCSISLASSPGQAEIAERFGGGRGYSACYGRGHSARYLEYKMLLVAACGGECSSQCGCLPGVLPADSWYERHVYTSWSVWQRPKQNF